MFQKCSENWCFFSEKKPTFAAVIQQTVRHQAYTILTFLLLMMVSPCQADYLGYTRDRPLIVGLDADFAPLQYVDEDGIPHGYDVDFTKELMKRMSIPFTYAPNTWEKIAGDVLHGRVDLGMMIYSDYRKDSTNYSRAVFRMYYQLIYRKDDADAIDPRNLLGKRIAYMRSRPVGEMLRREGAVSTVVSNMEKAINGLVEGSYDAVICFRYQANYFINHNGMSNLCAEDISLRPREYCYVSHDKALITAINAELRRMEEEGVTDNIYGKEIKSQFGAIVIPAWVWYMLASIVFLFLLIAFIILYISEKRLKEEHQKLLKAYDLLAENNDALQQAKAQAEESSRMKSNFIKQISHEIRTPLNAVSGFTQIITSPYMDLDSQTKQDLSQKITENTERITRLVSKMLELSEASSKTVLRCDDVATAEQIARQSIANSHISDARHIVFSLKVEPDAGAIPLKTNEHMAARALTQLLDNAQKFAKSGTVVLNIRTDQQQMLFVIEDTGIGIPPEEAEHIFEEFVQLDEYYDGTGIGLSVARSIARRLGGEIVLDTSYTGGARFVFSLPLS